MGLLSLFKRNDEPPAEPPATPDAVAQARARARRRLIGAAVLLAVGVIGFPLLFETQPRPVRMDIPIEIPRKDGAPPLAMPPAAAPAAVAVVPPPEVPAEAPPASPATAASAAPRAASAAIVTERAGEQGRELPPAAPKQASAASAARPAASASRLAAPADDGARAQAILEGQPPPAAASAASAADTPRIVVQVGAYTDADKLREVRAKVEKLGFKTYTQVVETDGAKRTRVRVGPFASKAEADKAAAKIKAAGLPAAMLVL
jgi:DedD protein